MKRTVTLGIVGIGVSAVMLFAGAVDGASDAKAVFVSNNCNTCHSITGAGVAKTGTSTAPDLSGVGNRHNAAWMSQYLMKTIELNGAKHVKKFKGSGADLTMLTAWLAQQKRK